MNIIDEIYCKNASKRVQLVSIGYVVVATSDITGDKCEVSCRKS